MRVAQVAADIEQGLQLDRWHTLVCREAAAEITRLRSKLAEAREALQFYAHPEQVEPSGCWKEDYPGGITYDGSKGEAFLDYGDRARVALAKLQEDPHA